jgi:hypothetical protein
VRQRILGDLLRDADRAAVDALPAVIHRALEPAGVRHVVLYLADYHATLLRPAPGSTGADGSRPTSQGLEGSAGACFETVRVVVDRRRGCLWAPVVERADVLGVLELGFEDLGDGASELGRDAGIMLGHLLVTARKYTDVYELLRRRRNMNLAAEMHWDVLPATTYVGPGVSVSCELEPAYEVGGDAFDYCLNDGTLDFTLIDAMGHGLRAALLSVQAVGAYRYARRRGQSLVEVAHTVDDSLRSQFRGRRFATGLFCRLDLGNGSLSWVNSGHVSPLRIRDGVVQELNDVPSACPMGVDLLGEVEAAEVSLRVGDRVLLYSDGVVEARAPSGEHLEFERLVDLVESHTHEHSPEELASRLIDEVLRHSAGPLRDDATVVVVDYEGAKG